MVQEIVDKVLVVLDRQLCQQMEGKNFEADTDLNQLTWDSFTFMKTVVALEKEFGIAFTVSKLRMGVFKTPRDFAAYIEKEIKFKEKYSMVVDSQIKALTGDKK